MSTTLPKVLIVDDDDNWLFISKRLLKRAGVENQEIATAKNGLEAFEFLKSLAEQRNQLPRYIFLDIKMPVVDGFGFLDLVFGAEGIDASQVKIYLCSSSFHPVDREKASQFPVADFLVKPLSLEAVQQALR